MSTDDEEPKSGGATSRSWFWILILLTILCGLFAVPFLVMGVVLKKTGWDTFHRVAEAAVATPPKPRATNRDVIPDLSALRSTVEKAASNALAFTELELKDNGLQIQVVPPATLETAANAVHEVLTKNHHQYVEAIDPDKIRIIVIIKSAEWSQLAQLLGESTQRVGFDYRGPSQTRTTTNGSDTMIAEIEILRKQSK